MRRLQSVVFKLSIVLVLFSDIGTAQSHRRDKWVQPEKVMDAVGVKPGMVIGEAGAGRGYLTFKLSGRVGEKGKIYANDIDRSALQAIKNQCKRESINNITTVQGEVDDPLFPVSELDMVIMLHAFHDFEKKVEWLKNVKHYMKPEAALVIIDGHNSHTKLNKERIQKMGEDAGFELVRYETFLPRDFIYVFRIKGSGKSN